MRFSVVFERPTRPPDRRPPEPAGEFSIDDELDEATDGRPLSSDSESDAPSVASAPEISAAPAGADEPATSSPPPPERIPFAQLDERTQLRLRAAEEDFRRHWSSVAPERLELVSSAAVAKRRRQHIEWLLTNGMDDELAELLERQVPAVAVFRAYAEAVAACRRKLPEIVARHTTENRTDAGRDDFRHFRIHHLELLYAMIARAVANANREMEIDEMRQLLQGGEFEDDRRAADRQEKLRLIYELSREKLELVHRRARAARNDASPMTDAERARLARIRKDLRAQLAGRRRVT